MNVKQAATGWMCVFVMAACGSDPEPRKALCDDDNVFALADLSYCIVIEEGFLTSECPPEFPEGRDFEGVIVCGEEPPPDEVREELVERGLLPADPCEGRDLSLYTSFDATCEASVVECERGGTPFKDACGCGCPAPAPECVAGDTRQEDCNTCQCVDGRWACTLIACECSGTATRPWICDTECECVAGTWSCPDVDCSIEECLAECGDGCPAPEFQPCGEDGNLYCNTCEMGCRGIEEAGSRDVCEDLTCEEACGIGCPAPEFQLCGADGNLYCNLCVMGCAGVSEAPSRDVCDGSTTCDPAELGDIECGPEYVCVDGRWEGPATCDPFACGMRCIEAGGSVCGADGNTFDTDCWRRCYGVDVADSPDKCDPDPTVCDVTDDLAVPVAWERLEFIAGCSLPFGFEGDLIPDQVLTSEEAFRAAFSCEEGAMSGVDWDTERVAIVSFAERPSADVAEVYVRDGRVVVQLAAEVYCGGARPPSAVVVVVIPAGDEAVEAGQCTYGRCPIGPPRA